MNKLMRYGFKTEAVIGWAATQVYGFPTQGARSTHHLYSRYIRKLEMWEFFNQQWFQGQWPYDSFNASIMAKEQLVPFTFSCAVWGTRFAKEVLV